MPDVEHDKNKMYPAFSNFQTMSYAKNKQENQAN